MGNKKNGVPPQKTNILFLMSLCYSKVAIFRMIHTAKKQHFPGMGLESPTGQPEHLRASLKCLFFFHVFPWILQLLTVAKKHNLISVTWITYVGCPWGLLVSPKKRKGLRDAYQEFQAAQKNINGFTTQKITINRIRKQPVLKLDQKKTTSSCWDMNES